MSRVPVNRGRKRLLAVLLVLAPAIVIAAVFVFAPKAETPRDDALPEGEWTPVAFGDVGAGDADHPASGNVTLYRNETGAHVLRFQGYDARSGPNVWFHLVPDADAATEEAVEGDGVRLRVPGPGQATYRGAFVVPVPEDVALDAYPVIVAWDRTLHERFAVATLAPV